MSGSTNANAIPREDLMGLMRTHIADPAGFVALQVLPEFDSPKPSVEWPRIPVEQLYNIYDTRRGDEGGYNRKRVKYVWDNYKIYEHGLEAPMNPDIAARYASWFDAEEIETMLLVDDIRRDLEKMTADLLFNATTFSGFTTGVSTEWSTVATAAPVDDAVVARNALAASCGKRRGISLLISAKVRENLGRSHQIKDWIKYTDGQSAAGDLGDAQIMRALQVDELIVGDQPKNNADEGQTASLADIWDDEYALFFVKSTGPSLTSPQGAGIGRIPIWRESASSLFFVESYPEDQTRSEVIRCRHFAEPKALYPAFGHLLSNITA